LGVVVASLTKPNARGSTLMDDFNNRRDLTEMGTQRRNKFEELLNIFDENGLDKKTARTELIKVLRGEKRKILSNIRPPTNVAHEPK